MTSRKLVNDRGLADARWGAALSARLVILGAWAERQGLELAADCHLARCHQAARLIQGSYRTVEDIRLALSACFKLNSVQVRALLGGLEPALLEAGVAAARAAADELCTADGRQITLEENEWLGVGLLIPGDGFSAEVVRGVPPGLADFVAPLQRGGLCRLAHQPHAVGVWTVYMTGYGAPQQRRAPEPRVHIIQLNKNSNGMGLSIVAAKGAGQSKLGIYIKSVVAGGAAAADGRLAAGDQLLSVDGHSLVGITQEKAAEYLVRTGPTVTLEVAKQGAVLHGLATLLHQPTYNQKQGASSAARRASERDLPSRLAAEPVKPSKSTPALHQVASPPPMHAHNMSHAMPPPGSPGHKSRSSHNLLDARYQNLVANMDRWSSLRSSNGSNRPQSAHFSPNNTEPAPDSPLLHHQQNHSSSASVRSAKMAEMSEEVTRRHQQQQLQQQMHQQQMQYPTQQKPILPPQHIQPHPNIMSPPQIQNQHPHMQANQHAQTNNHMPQNHMQNQHIPPNVVQSQMLQHNHLPQTQHAPQNQLISPNQHMQQNQHIQQNQHMSPNQVPNQHLLLQSQPGMQMSPPAHRAQSPTQHIYHNQNVQSQRYEWHQPQPGPPSPQRSQPPVAPKPQ
ncbi:hypothetical protein JYU34_016587, partial [Plutella xylostella]